MRLGVDILGGDFAPEATVLGSILAFKELSSDVRLVLIGNEPEIKKICEREKFDPSNFDYVHTTNSIGMGEHPAKTYQQKPDSSIALGFGMLKHGQIDGLASAGNTGAMMVGAVYTVKAIPGVIRPVILTTIPQVTGTPLVLLDVGINPDARPDVLCQYGLLGSIYSESVYHVENPKVALLNIGSEDQKGNLVSKETFQLMKEAKEFNFIGNLEGNDLFSGKANVLVCDGFVGNIVLKEAEAFYTLLKKRKIEDDFFNQFNFEVYGGTPVLGVNAPVIIGHGRSNERAIKNMILQTRQVIEARICEKIKDAFNNVE
ncbi:MAG: phosphate acyltransferase PlsX [Bacteroidota bacterium]|nr:phosphate acyltransferase PlsX [Bacteroidota bacterium]MDP4225606.1 phosphate acyltransferase PlsX [Bacteroidota bacterium]MDP4274144.1 phosphate acyltransferase PlsX [Bacteroidota bacterium]